MNRHERRKAAAQGRRTGYLHRILAGFKPSSDLHFAAIEHDRNCAIYDGSDCNCVPDISISDPHGGVTTIDEHGNTTKTRTQ